MRVTCLASVALLLPFVDVAAKFSQHGDDDGIFHLSDDEEEAFDSYTPIYFTSHSSSSNEALPVSMNVLCD